jgi:tetratricopeptide (TPR) repeat protein
MYIHHKPGFVRRFVLPTLLLVLGILFLRSLASKNFKLTQAAVQGQAPSTRSPQEQLIYHNNIGIALLEQFSFREALAEFDKCLKINPDFLPAQVNSGLAHFYLQEFPQAEAFLKKALALDPNQPRALFALGMIERNKNQLDLAIDAFKKILSKEPQDPQTLYQVGQIYLKKQDYGQAETYLRKVVQLSPYDVAAHYNLATTLIRKGEQAEGQKVMEAFTRLREKGGNSSTGTQYGEQGKYMMAIGEYPDIKDLAPQASAGVGHPIQFVDAAAAAGIRFRHGAQVDVAAFNNPLAASEFTPEFARKNLVAAMGSGAAFCDYDKDGYLDLYLANCSADASPSRGALYHNDGKGHYVEVSQKAGIQSTGLGMGAYWGDFNNDGLPDLFLTNYGPSALYQNNGNGTFTDVTAKAGVGGGDHWHLSAAVADYDHDGDLDIYVAHYVDLNQKPPGQSFHFPEDFAGEACHLFRNNGDGTFTDVAEDAKVKVPLEKITSVAFTDFDNRRDVDFWTVSQNKGNHLYSNQRVGTFQDLALGPVTNLKTFSVAVADYNKDEWMDFVLVPRTGPPVLVKNAGNGTLQPENLASSQNSLDTPALGWTAQFFDYDNDGDLDLFVLRGGYTSEASKDMGPELWENQGEGKFSNVSEKVGLLPFRGKAYRSASFGDFDNDGDTDIVLTVNGASPVLLRNEGGSQNNWIKVRLQGTNSNKSGIGTKVEIKSGTLWQKVEVNGGTGYLSQSPPEVIFGLGNHKSVDALRLLWPGGVLQSEINLPVNQTRLVQELDRKGTSCPLLYTWNGAKFQFVTDFLGGCAIGYLEAPGQYNTPDTDEYVKISPGQLRPKDGKYSLRINNQLEEVLYIDQTELVALDHPADLEIFPNERLMPEPPYPGQKIFTARNAHPPKAAWDQHHQDVLPLITEIDRTYPANFELLPYKGYAEQHDLILDLGDLSRAKNVNLLMTAWIDYADSTANFRASQVGAKLVPPYLQVKNPEGQWETVVPSMGFPAGLPKTMVVDVTGKFLCNDYRVRIVTSMRIYWDQILVNTFSDIPPLKQYRLAPQYAELRFCGFPREFSPDLQRPFIYDYEWIEPVAPWKSHTGDYTRFGEVTRLLKSKEDMYVIMRNGDEIQIDFDASQLPPVAEGWVRSFLLYADGFGKDMDIHSAAPDTVTPLPFHGMSSYPYPAHEKYPEDEAHRRYQREYNTRTIPSSFSQLSQQQKSQKADELPHVH